jgi:hypothetical protein
MAANVDAIALVPDGAGDAADTLGAFEDDGPDSRTAAELKRCGEAGRTGSDDDCGSVFWQLTPCRDSGKGAIERRIRVRDPATPIVLE